jgi:hypothetical protein
VHTRLASQSPQTGGSPRRRGHSLCCLIGPRRCRRRERRQTPARNTPNGRARPASPGVRGRPGFSTSFPQRCDSSGGLAAPFTCSVDGRAPKGRLGSRPPPPPWPCWPRIGAGRTTMQDEPRGRHPGGRPPREAPIQATGSRAGDHGRDCVDGGPSLWPGCACPCSTAAAARLPAYFK